MEGFSRAPGQSVDAAVGAEVRSELRPGEVGVVGDEPRCVKPQSWLKEDRLLDNRGTVLSRLGSYESPDEVSGNKLLRRSRFLVGGVLDGVPVGASGGDCS